MLLAACRHSATGPSPGRPQDVASIRLIDQNGYDNTQHVPLYPGYPTTLTVHPYRADGSEISVIEGGVMTTFSFVPASLVSTQTAGSLTIIVSASAPPGTAGSFTVMLTFPTIPLVKTFGPFSTLIHSLS